MGPVRMGFRAVDEDQSRDGLLGTKRPSESSGLCRGPAVDPPGSAAHSAPRVCLIFPPSPGNPAEDQGAFWLSPHLSGSTCPGLTCAQLSLAEHCNRPALCVGLGRGRKTRGLPSRSSMNRSSSEEGMRCGRSWRKGKRQLGRGEQAISGNPRPPDTSQSKGKELSLTCSVSQVGAVAMSQALWCWCWARGHGANAKTTPCSPGVHTLCPRHRASGSGPPTAQQRWLH